MVPLVSAAILAYYKTWIVGRLTAAWAPLDRFRLLGDACRENRSAPRTQLHHCCRLLEGQLRRVTLHRASSGRLDEICRDVGQLGL